MYFDSLPYARLQKLPHLRRHHIEGMDNEKFRLSECRLFQQRNYDVGKPRTVGVALFLAMPRVGPGPSGESFRVFIRGKTSFIFPGDAPFVDKAPGFPAIRGGARHGQQRITPFTRADCRLPKFLFLRAREEQWKPRRDVGIKCILVEALDESAEGKDVRGFPDREAGLELQFVELARQGLRESPVRRDDDNAFGMPPGEMREELALVHCRELGANSHGA